MLWFEIFFFVFVYTKADILKYMKSKNIEDLSDIVIGEVKPNGNIVLLKKEYIN